MVNVNRCGCGDDAHQPRHAWITVAQAAALMGLCKRQASKRLHRLNDEMGGRLLRSIGDKRMPDGVRASKFLVSTEVYLQAMRPVQTNAEQDIEQLRVELVLTNEKLEGLRRRLRALAQPNEI